MMFECLWLSKVKELESTVQEHRSEISRLEDELRMARPSTISESEFILYSYMTVLLVT